MVATRRGVRDEHRDDATGRIFEHDLSPYRDASGTVRGVVGFRREVTDRVEALWQARERSEFQQLLMDLAVGFVNTPVEELDEAIDVARQRTGAFAAVDRAYVFRYDVDAGTTSNTHEWCAEGVEPQIDELQDVPLELVADWVSTHLRGRSMHVHDVQQLPSGSGIRQILEPQGVITLIALPIAAAGVCFGFVGFDVVTGRRDWSTTEHQLLRVLAELLANAELRRRYEQELIETRQHEAAARDRLELVLEAVDDAIWEWQAATGLTSYSAALFRLVGRDDAPTISGDELLTSLLTPLDRGHVYREAGKALAGDAARFETQARLRHVDGHAVPVRIDGVIVRDGEGTPVRMAGLVVDLTQQLQEAERQRRRLEYEAVLARISARFVGFEAFDTALDLALADLARSYDASRASLVQLRDAGVLELTHQWCQDGVAARSAGAQDRRLEKVGFWMDRLAAGPPVLIDDARDVAPTGSRAHPTSMRPEVRSMLALPLMVGGRLEGVLELDQIERYDAWSDEDLALLRAAAQIIAGAMARSRTEQALVAAREQADIVNEAKTRFLSTISHELRTPMTAVLGMTELLLEDDLTERQRSFVTAARDAASGLLLLLGDLLDIARIEQRRGLAIVLQVDATLPALALTDGARLRQIVTNLVSNAVRFTEQGSVTLSAARVSDGDGDPRLCIEVVDTGIGIPADRQQEVFEPFTQVDPTPTRRVDGSGLGLSIVRELVGCSAGGSPSRAPPASGPRSGFSCPSRRLHRTSRTSRRL